MPQQVLRTKNRWEVPVHLVLSVRKVPAGFGHLRVRGDFLLLVLVRDAAEVHLHGAQRVHAAERLCELAEGGVQRLQLVDERDHMRGLRREPADALPVCAVLLDLGPEAWNVRRRLPLPLEVLAGRSVRQRLVPNLQVVRRRLVRPELVVLLGNVHVQDSPVERLGGLPDVPLAMRHLGVLLDPGGLQHELRDRLRAAGLSLLHRVDARMCPVLHVPEQLFAWFGVHVVVFSVRGVPGAGRVYVHLPGGGGVPGCVCFGRAPKQAVSVGLSGRSDLRQRFEVRVQVRFEHVLRADVHYRLLSVQLPLRELLVLLLCAGEHYLPVIVRLLLGRERVARLLRVVKLFILR